jgi:hypothetical protein
VSDDSDARLARPDWYIDDDLDHAFVLRKYPACLFKEYVEPSEQSIDVDIMDSKQTVTIEVPEGFKIKSRKVIDNQIVVELEPELNLVVVSSTDTVLTIKPEFLEKLKKLGVYEKWLSNVKAQWNEWGVLYCDYGIMSKSWYDFIYYSFHWRTALDGRAYWYNVASDK